jgi:hypothetical protein
MDVMTGEKRKKIWSIVAVAVLAAGATFTTIAAMDSPAWNMQGVPDGGGAVKVNK